jgi:hypothetical protein
MREITKSSAFGLAGLALIGAGIAGLATGLSAHSLRSAPPSAAEIVASRFPSAQLAPSQLAPSKITPSQITPSQGAASENVPSEFAPVLWHESFAWPSVVPADDPALFSPAPSYLLKTATEASALAPASGDPAQPVPQNATAIAEPPSGPAADASRRRAASRPGSVLNDAQIASIRERLNLTPEQERMWPPVEAALRGISYTRKPAEAQGRLAQQSGGRLAFIDPGSAQVRELKYAALPLIMRLDDDQKREVNSLSHVMGLGKLASQF